ncbi:MAG TPA: methylated-DNA--[protein]-cysteine S-methyltransferase [Candidatus Hydrogenedentes bacterium]|nr:methylated-DNA--[protein]-cysteine S-methyltransferase [Candidatus Hydrogenedentota bacterium]
MDAANFKFHHPKGVLYGLIGEKGLCELLLPRENAPKIHFLHSASNITLGRELYQALDRYFSGQPEEFKRIPLDLGPGTAFQQLVWKGARAIQWGTTCSYGELAKRIGKPLAMRAVGQALGANPIPILVPCHRILGANGKLTGFSAGMHWKVELLKLEGKVFP